MCFGGGGKPSYQPPPTPAPSPQVLAPTMTESAKTDSERQQKLKRLRSGLASTIKTGAKELTGSGSDVTQQLLGKEKLG